jgi:tetratricopeptide (TPR) repeat protein
VLAAATFATFASALRCDFVCYDDPDYVTKNQYVTSGLTLKNTSWAFSTFTNSNWHPLTWLSLQLDGTLWWPDPMGFHLTSVLLHAANAALLFLALHALTGAFWPSLATAVLFAVHPLRVESVAWVSERKDVLSIFFGLLALLAYAAYVQRPSFVRYAAVGVAFAASLLCKPMLVTLPCLLLVLDWWPLGRVRALADWRRLALEKIPLFVLVAASAAITYRAQLEQSAVGSLELFPPELRVENAAVSYVTYLAKTVWPAGLAIYYPHPRYDTRSAGAIPMESVATAVVLFLALTIGAYALRRRAPYLLSGWLWYVGTLVPVIGLVQVGSQAYADRYTYFPQIGALMALSWGVADLAAGHARLALAAGAAAALGLAAATQQQLTYWRDSVALWQHALDVTYETPTALMNLGVAREAIGDIGAASDCYRRALRLQPDAAGAVRIRVNLANALFGQSRQAEASAQQDVAKRLLAEAIAHLHEADRLAPDQPETVCNLGRMEESRGNLPLAVRHYERAVALKRDYALGYIYLGSALIELGKETEGRIDLEKGLQLDPRSAEGHGMLAALLDARGDLAGAADHFEQAIRYGPKLAGSWFGLGSVYLKQGRRADAERCLRHAVELEPGSALFRQGQAAPQVGGRQPGRR